MLCEMIFKQSCGISLVDGTARCPIGGDLDQREWPAKLCIVVHGGSCCLQSTSAKKSLSAFSRSRRHQIRILFYYSTTYRTQFQYIFMPPPVKCSFKDTLKCYFLHWQSMGTGRAISRFSDTIFFIFTFFKCCACIHCV